MLLKAQPSSPLEAWVVMGVTISTEKSVVKCRQETFSPDVCLKTARLLQVRTCFCDVQKYRSIGDSCRFRPKTRENSLLDPSAVFLCAKPRPIDHVLTTRKPASSWSAWHTWLCQRTR